MENNQACLTVVDAVEGIAADGRMPWGGTIVTDLQRALLSSHDQGQETLVDCNGIPEFVVGTSTKVILGQINCSVLTIMPPRFATPVI